MPKAPLVRRVWQAPVPPQRQKGGASLMLWALPEAVCFFICIIGAVGAARHAGASLVGFAIAVVIGLLLGGVCTWIMWIVGEKVGAALELLPEPRRERYFNALYVARVLWVFIALYITDHVTATALRLAR